MATEVVVFEDGKEVQREDLAARGYMVLTNKAWEIGSIQRWPSSGTVQLTIKRATAPTEGDGNG